MISDSNERIPWYRNNLHVKIFLHPCGRSIMEDSHTQ